MGRNNKNLRNMTLLELVLRNITIYYIYFSMCAEVETGVYRSHGSIMKYMSGLCQTSRNSDEAVALRFDEFQEGIDVGWSGRVEPFSLTAEGNKTKQKTSKDNNIFMNS